MTTVLRARTSADFLALVPALVGTDTGESLVCVTFRGRRTAGVVRHSLPVRRRSTEYRALATAVVATLSRMPEVDAVVPVLYSGTTFAAERGIPWIEFMRTLRSRLRHAGFDVKDELCVAADGWGSYLDPDCPREGRPLAEIAASELATRAGELPEEPDELASWAVVPESRPHLRTALTDVLDVLHRRDPQELDALVAEVPGGADLDVHEVIERWLDADDEFPMPLSAWVGHLVQRPAWRDVVMLQVAFGRGVGEVAADLADAERIRTQSTDPGPECDPWPEDAREQAAEALGRLLAGDATVRPDADRVRRAATRTRALVAHLPLDLRPTPLCVLAWWAWALGRGSVAGALLEQVFAIDGEHRFARLLDVAASNGKLPEWVFVAPRP